MKKWIALFVLFMPCISLFGHSNNYDNYFCVVNTRSQGTIVLVDSYGDLILAGPNCISQLPIFSNNMIDDPYQNDYYFLNSYRHHRPGSRPSDEGRRPNHNRPYSKPSDQRPSHNKPHLRPSNSIQYKRMGKNNNSSLATSYYRPDSRPSDEGRRPNHNRPYSKPSGQRPNHNKPHVRPSDSIQYKRMGKNKNS